MTETLRLDLHIHSWFSYDCFQSPQQIVDIAHKRGLDGIAVTDHDTFDGSLATTEIVDDLLLISGEEVRTDDYDDLLALFIDEPIESRQFTDAVAEIHDQGGVAVLPHPYRKFETVPEWVIETIDAIEGLNARSKLAKNDRARELGQRYQCPLIGGSDAHTPWEIGIATTLVKANPVDVQRIKDKIRAGEIDYSGSETPYYLSHAASLFMEKTKARTGYRKRSFDTGHR